MASCWGLHTALFILLVILQPLGTLGYHISDKQLNHAPLRFCSTEHGPACLAHCARSQRVLCFPIIYLSHLVIVIVTKFAIHQVLTMLTHSQFCHLSLHETGYTWSHLVTKCSLVITGHKMFLGHKVVTLVTLSLSKSIRKEISARTHTWTLTTYYIDERGHP